MEIDLTHPIPRVGTRLVLGLVLKQIFPKTSMYISIIYLSTRGTRDILKVLRNRDLIMLSYEMDICLQKVKRFLCKKA